MHAGNGRGEGTLRWVAPGAVAELTTVADDEIVVHDGPSVHVRGGLRPATQYRFEGLTARTLPDLGLRLATVATVNDVHFGETECGRVDGHDVSPVLRAAPGDPPYPEVMSAGAVAEITALGPDLVVAKGDLTADGTQDQYERYRAVYGAAFGDRLVTIRGNHDAYDGATFEAHETQRVDLPGLTVAVLDSSVAGRAGGTLSHDQLDWLDDLARCADRPVLVLTHHHVWDPASTQRPADYFGIDPDASEALVSVVARRKRVLAVLSGHTHRCRVRRFAATGAVRWVEVASVKEFPGAWAEYRVHEGGLLQVLRRISTPEALEWSDRTRALYEGTYERYAFGELADRCFAVLPR